MALQFVGDQIANNQISNAHLQGSIADSKLLAISTANKVLGSALQLASGSGLEDSSGLKISTGGVTDGMLDGNISFSKLADNANIARLDQNETVAGSWGFNAIPSCSVSASADTHLTNKAYVDSVAQGLHPKESCKLAATGNLTLSGTQTIDSVAASAGDRILCWQQTDQTQNGVYIVAAGAWARAADLNAGSEFPGASFFVREGGTYATTGFVCSNSSVSLGSTNITFVQYTGAGQIGAGNGISKNGNTISVDLATASGMEFAGGKLQLDIAASKAVQLASNELTLVLDGSTLSQSGSGIKVATGGISNNEIHASAAIADSKLAQITTANKVAGSAVGLKSGNTSGLEDSSGLRVKTDGVNIQIGSGNNAVEIVPASITNALIHASAAIADTKLAQITTANKVAGSAVGLKSGNASGLEDSSGLRVKTDGVNIQIGSGNNAIEIVPASITNALIHASAAIADSKLAQLTTANKVAGSAVQVATAGALEDATGLKVKVDNATVEINANALRVKDGAIGLDKMSVVPKCDQFTISGSSTTSLNLTQRVTKAAWRDPGNILVFRNGQKLWYSASPSGNSEFSIGDNGSATSITVGAAFANADKIEICYKY